MNSTNNNSFEIAAQKVFSDLYVLIKEDENKIDDKPFKFDLSIMPDDVISCIGNHLEDYPFEIYKDTELYKLFFKHDKPDDYKEYIKYINDIKNHKTYEEYDFTESCKTDISFLLLNIKKYFKELKIKKYEIKFRHEKYTERGLEPEIKISPKIYFYDKDNFNCLCISEMNVTERKKIINGCSEVSRPFKHYFTNVEEKKLNKIFEELIKDFKLYTKRCVAFNCNYNNEFDLRLKKYLKQNKTKIINDKPKQINVLDSSTDILKDDEPKPVNLLDLSTDILNIIGGFVKKDNKTRGKKELMDGEQIINGRKIIFPTFCGGEIDRSLNTKEDIKEYIFDYIISNFPYIKKCATMFKIRLSNDDKRKCFWILFKRCKLIINRNKEYYNKDVYNMDDNEEKEFFMEYLKLKNLSLPQKMTFEY